MKKLLLILLTVVMAACSSARPKATPVAAAPEQPSGAMDLTGRWTGTWTGTGLLMAPREDSVTLELLQTGKVGFGRLVLDGATAAESVPQEIRNAGLWGIRVHAKMSGNKVTIRHEAGGHLFAADLKLAADGEHLYGLVRGDGPRVGLMLTRKPDAMPAPQTAMVTPPPAPPKMETPTVEEPKPVAMAPEPPKEPETPAPQREEQFIALPELTPIHFDFDKAELRKDAVDTLTSHLEWLKDHADALVLIEGHCDERGTDEYNVALGERRAKSVSDMLAAHGIPAERISTTSFGRERPVCTGKTEDCRMKNRRAEFRVKTK
jgi:peptidoglycan-associated lipoprotein